MACIAALVITLCGTGMTVKIFTFFGCSRWYMARIRSRRPGCGSVHHKGESHIARHDGISSRVLGLRGVPPVPHQYYCVVWCSGG